MEVGTVFSSGSAKRRTPSSQIRLAIYGTQLLLDLLILTSSFLLASAIRFGELPQRHSAEWLFVLIPSFMIVAFYGRLYTLQSLQSFKTSARRSVAALAWSLTITMASLFLVKDVDAVSRFYFIIGSALSGLMLLAARVGLNILVKGPLSDRILRKLLIVDRVDSFSIPGYDLVLAEQLGMKLDLYDPVALHMLSSIVQEYDRVLVNCAVEDREKWSLFLQAVGCIGSLLIPELQPVISDHAKINLEAASIRVSTGPLDLRSRLIKRSFDLLIASLAFGFVLPLLVIVAICIKLDSRGPILFKQIRMGRGNRLFYVYKFRSMRDDLSDLEGSVSASREDKRITRVGKIIRATSVDELPQLLNVLKGDMSLVGPRPHALGSRAGDDLFWHVDVRYWLRHSTKPGITGLAQVRGYRGATDTRTDLTERLRCDLEYVRNWSIFRDMTILLATLGVIIHKKAY